MYNLLIKFRRCTMSKYFIGQIIDQVTITNKLRENNKTRYVCSCSCGAVTTKVSHQLGLTHVRCVDCGNKASGEKRRTFTFEHKESPEYRVWSNMKNRCTNPNYYLYHRYGGRGIAMSQEWADSFEKFFIDMGSRPNKTYSIDRINNDLGYNKDNCRWATLEEQANNMSTNRLIEINGTTKTLAGWCREYKVNYSTIQARIDRFSMSPEDALIQGAKHLQPRYVYLVDGESFSTVSEVSVSFGIGTNTASNRFKSPRFESWVKIRM